MSGPTELDRFLLRACSPREKDAAGVPAAAWPEVLERAAPHKLTNLVLARWAQAVPELPEPARTARRDAAVQNLAMTARLVELLDVFESHGIAAAPFKGPLLAETVFGGLGDRSFGDLDILLPREDLARACRLALDLGYRPFRGVPLDDYLRITLRGGHHVCLQHERHGTFVELHWEMSGRYLQVGLDFETVRPLLERVEFRGRSVWNLSPELGLLYLCVHGAKEYWRILDHVVCVAWHLERRPPNWGALIDLAGRWGAMNILLTGLGLAAVLFDSALPERVVRMSTESPGVRRLIARQSERILAPDRLVTLSLGNLTEFLRMHWVQIGDARHFLRWMVRKLATPPVEDLDPLGAQKASIRWKVARAPFAAVRRLFARAR